MIMDTKETVASKNYSEPAIPSDLHTHHRSSAPNIQPSVTDQPQLLNSNIPSNDLMTTNWINSKAQISMLIISVLVSAFISIYVARKIWLIWKRSKVIQKEAHDEALLQQAHQGRGHNSTSRNEVKDFRDRRPKTGKNGMTEGQWYKFSFLIGLFLTNFIRCAILIYDGFFRRIFSEKSFRLAFNINQNPKDL